MLQYSTFGRDIQKIYCFSYINTGDLTIYTKTDTPVSKQPKAEILPGVPSAAILY